MNIDEVKELLSQFDQSSLTEFDFRKDNFELYMNKNTTSGRVSIEAAPAQVNYTEKASETVVSSNESKSAKQDEKSSTQPVLSADVEVVASPIVGVVYLQPSPEKEVFKKVGDAVKKGEVICIIEAMKLMNEITAPIDGTITDILIHNEDVVEYDQPLFHISKGV